MPHEKGKKPKIPKKPSTVVPVVKTDAPVQPGTRVVYSTVATPLSKNRKKK